MMAFLLAAAVFTRPMERVESMDPAKSQAMYTAQAISLVYEAPLSIDYTARPYKLAPGYCELPEISSDGLTYTFKVREGRSAHDMVSSLERIADKNLVSPNGWMVQDIKSVRASDDLTVEIKLKRKVHYFPWLMAMPSAGVVGKDLSGTGPYRLKYWRRNHEMVFERRHPAEGLFDVVRYCVIDDASTRWLMFLKGEIDILGNISRDNWDAVVKSDGTLNEDLSRRGIRLLSGDTLDVLYIGFNMDDPVVGTNKKLRQALNAAFDYPTWKKFYNGSITLSDGPLPYGVEGKINEPFAYSWNLDKAKRLMCEAGYAGGIDPKTSRRLVLTLSLGRATQEGREAGELLASFYEKIGIKLELKFMTWEAFLRSVNEGRVQMYQLGWVGDYPDAQNFLQLFYSKNARPGPNRTNYSSPAFDRAYEAALSADSSEKRNAYWIECQRILREDCPWVFTHCNKSFSLVNRRVENYVPSAFPYGNEAHFRLGGFSSQNHR
jgi:ABC-type transport system substrate-binding protein